MTDLPPGWEWAPLGEVADLIQGQSPPGNSYNTHGDGVPFFQGKAEFGDLFPTVRKWTSQPQKLARAGDILLSIRAPVGPTNLAPIDCAIGRGLTAIRPRAGIDQRYLLWALRVNAKALAAKSTGSTFEAISGKQLSSHALPIAPPAEQRRIVAEVEYLTSRHEEGRKTLSRAGYLVPTLAAAIRDQHVNCALPDASSAWRRGRLADVVLDIEAGKSLACLTRAALDGEWGIIKVSAMTWGDFRAHENKALPDELLADPRHEIKPGDILVSRANTPAYVGAPVLVRECRSRLLLSDKSLRLLPREGVDREWLFQVLSAPSTRRQISALATGTKDSMRNISQQALLSIEISIPPKADQQAIGQSLRESMQDVARLAQQIRRLEEQASLLRRRVLAEAFAGRLVPQDPNDEPASELLARIRTERAAVAPVKRRGRRAGLRSRGAGQTQKETLL